MLCSLHCSCSPNETLARRLKSTQLVAQMLSVPFNTEGSTKLSVTPISNWRAVIPAQAPARWVRGPECSSTQTQQSPYDQNYWGFILSILQLLFQSLRTFRMDSAASCITYKTQFNTSHDMWNISAREIHNYKHNCITASRWGIKQNNTCRKHP